MSDDDYAADSPFDGLDEYYFWDDAASQDVADDLAEHTLPSPVFLEDPAYEMMGGYSDWEYYSDDYYDDDPNLLKKNPQEGSPPTALNIPNGQRSSHTIQKRGRKRKLADTEDIPTISLAGPDLAEIVQNIGHNITGTTWKTDESDSQKLYHQGQTKRVALLEDWRNVFWESQPKSDRRSKGKLKNRPAWTDEWANDLGLADMGLMTATGKHISKNDIGNNYVEEEPSDSEEGRPFQHGRSSIQRREMPRNDEVDLPTGDLLLEEEEEDNQDFYASETTKLKARSTTEVPRPKKRKKNAGERVESKILDSENDSNTELQLAEHILSTSKKTETAFVSSVSARPKRNTNATTSVNTLESPDNRTQLVKAPRKKQAIPLSESRPLSPGKAHHATANATAATLPSKKRKTTTETAAEENDGVIAGTASSRAKRVASDRTGLRNDDGTQPRAQLPKPATRGFRPRKK
jgi:hypothetical protein